MSILYNTNHNIDTLESKKFFFCILFYCLLKTIRSIIPIASILCDSLKPIFGTDCNNSNKLRNQFLYEYLKSFRTIWIIYNTNHNMKTLEDKIPLSIVYCKQKDLQYQYQFFQILFHSLKPIFSEIFYLSNISREVIYCSRSSLNLQLCAK